METDQNHEFASPSGAIEIAVKTAPAREADLPGVVWLGGFRSDMTGTKAQTVVDLADKIGCASLRFDYSGHGTSGGSFEDGTISQWVAESLDVFRTFTEGPQVLVGSSMGGWVALRLVQELQHLGEQDRLAGLLLIAPAPDFTKELMEPAFTDDQWSQLQTAGRILEESAYSDEPNTITKALIEDGRKNLVFGNQLNIGVPVRILQGMEDPDVPYAHAFRLFEELMHDDVTMTTVKDGDHRLSKPKDITLLQDTLTALVCGNRADS